MKYLIILLPLLIHNSAAMDRSANMGMPQNSGGGYPGQAASRPQGNMPPPGRQRRCPEEQMIDQQIASLQQQIYMHQQRMGGMMPPPQGMPMGPQMGYPMR